MNSVLLNRSASRLYKLTGMHAPDIIIEHEIALTVRLFGTRKVFWRVLKNAFDLWRIQMEYQQPEHGDVISQAIANPVIALDLEANLPIKVYAVTDTDWFAGPEAEGCTLEYLNNYDGDPDIIEEFGDPQELPEEALQRLEFHDEERGVCTFREELDRLIAEGATFPRFFATTEY